MKLTLECHSVSTGNEILDLVRWQVAFGPRYPGSPGHYALKKALLSRLKSCADHVIRQDFSIFLKAQRADCDNLIGVFKAKSSKKSGSLLLGSHFDTRVKADRETKINEQRLPIPGANDGGSGTAVLLNLLDFLKTAVLSRDVLVVFFDAEDVGDIDNHSFSVGARFFVENPKPSMPSEVIVLDMVGGRDMALNIDAHILNHPASMRLTSALFRIGVQRGFSPFIRKNKERLRYIICDHYPFLRAGIPSCLLIDLDYPEWHTQRDLPEAMSSSSLAMISEVLRQYLSRFQV